MINRWEHSRKRRLVVVLLVVLALVGIADASFLTAHHYQGTPVNCSIGGAQIGECNTVLSSEYATLFGVPISFFGALYYFVLLVFSALLFSYPKKLFFKTLVGISGLGLFVSSILTYIQLSILEEICFYCMTSAITTLAFFCLSFYAERKQSKPLGEIIEV